jgi:MoaA/NifB/PqqE/SkfB family radical SAM enzyme
VVAEGYAAGYRHLHLTGGEPLLWANLFDLLEDVRKMGYHSVFLNTNGTLLTPAVSRRMAAVGPLALSISLEASEGLHDRIRGAGAWSRGLSGLRSALAAGLDTLVFTTAFRRALPLVPRFAAETFAAFPGITGIVLIQLVGATRHQTGLSAELLGPEDFLGMVRSVALLNLYGYPVDILYSPLAHVAARRLNMPWIPRSRPLVRNGHLMIRADGTLAFAHSEKGCAGTYRPGMIQRVLASDAHSGALAPDGAVCPSCRFVDLCRSNGMNRPIYREMDEISKTPYCVRVMELSSI